MVPSIKALLTYQDVIQKLGRTVDLDENKKFGTGDTVSRDGCVQSASVGVDKLTKNIEISDTDFMSGLVSIYREHRHVEQIDMIHNDKTGYSTPLKLSYYASQACPDYGNKTISRENYLHSPREIEAEMYGTYAAHTILKNTYGKTRADNLLADYVNERIANDDYFLSNQKSYKNLEEIEYSLAGAYEQAVYCSRTYNDKECKTGKNVAKQVLNSSKEMSKAMKKESVGWKKDWMLATTYLNQPENQHLVKDNPGLACVDWSYDQAFKITGFAERLKSKSVVKENRGKMAENVLQIMAGYNPYEQGAQYGE